jgi:hypothetical protein
MARIRVYNPSFCVLAYLESNLAPKTPLWLTQTVHEERFLHGTDPASLHALTQNGRVELFWVPDRRPELIGASYNVYRKRPTDGAGVRLTTTLPNAQSYTDATIAAGTSATYWITARSTLGVEYVYSDSITVIASAPLYPGWGTMTVATTPYLLDSTNVIVTIEGESGISAPLLLVDKDRDLTFSSAEQTAMRSISGGQEGRTLYTATVHVHADSSAGYGFMILGSAGADVVVLPATGNFTTDINNRVRNTQYGFYGMNISDPNWITVLSDSTVKLTSKGYSGLFLDDMVPYLRWMFFDSNVVEMTDAQYKAAVSNLLTTYRARNSSIVLVYNGLSTLSMDFLAIADGGMEEGFVESPWSPGGYVSTDGWVDQVNHTLRAMQFQRRGVFDVVRASYKDIPGRIYGLASYFMAKGDKHYLAVQLADTSAVYLPEFDLQMGVPIETYQDVTLYRHGSGLYGRRFEKGLVLVNPTDQTYTETLPTTLYRVDPVGDLVPELGGNGRLTYTPVSGSITLAPKKAVILLDSTNGQP